MHNSTLSHYTYSHVLNFNVIKIGKLTLIDSGRYVKCEDLANTILPDEYIPFHDVIYLPCVYTHTDYATYPGLLCIDKGVISILAVGNSRTEGWVSVCGCFLNKDVS